ncbi:MAG: ATP-binding protein [Chitinophagales bacterium]|nr:ATP-binding protein [Chitinophagales bacterium]
MLDVVKKITDIDFFKEGQNEDLFVGRPFAINYNKANLLISDFWKHKVKGIPQGSFLLAFYDNPHDEEIQEALLLRVLNPTSLPTDNNVISSMVEYYKDNLNTSGKKSDLDDFTKYEFSFSGLECRILGAFYKDDEIFEFGADVENFYSAHNYKVYKAAGKILQLIVNQRDKDLVAGGENEFPIGKVRYSSSKRFYAIDESINKVQVYINPGDMLGKRTSLFGMTRTGKSNTVKKIIQATVEISKKSKYRNLSTTTTSTDNFMEPIDKDRGAPKFPVGQIIFDINGEYANANLQDKGTAIFDLYKDLVIRYSVLDKTDEGFKVLKTNFYTEIQAGFELVRASMIQDSSNYIQSVCAIDLNKPEGYEKKIQDRTSDEKNAANLYDRKTALYKACLYAAGFKTNQNKVKFFGDSDTINNIIPDVQPHSGITLDECITWFTAIYEATADPTSSQHFIRYRQNKGFDYLDEDMRALLVFLTRKSTPNGTANLSGFRKLRAIANLHTPTVQESFEIEIVKALREGKIVIIDLSQGDPLIQRLYSEKICSRIFNDSMNNFIKTSPNNFVQFYFEEAHNLFPKKDDKDLSQIYNRIAKEGAKLNLGMIYATQEVSSISSNILKNTQNWFIAHLNNEDETRELKKYYDFVDFTDSLVRFSAKNDKGFVRMKTYSNPFVVPVQIDQFLANK